MHVFDHETYISTIFLTKRGNRIKTNVGLNTEVSYVRATGTFVRRIYKCSQRATDIGSSVCKGASRHASLYSRIIIT
jgi:hypothetical protein